jgi:hypothetical protein
MNRSVFAFVMIAMSLSFMGCDERGSACPEVTLVEPAMADPGAVVVVEGEGFAPEYSNLWDDGEVTPPSVVFTIAPSDLLPAELAELDFELTAAAVSFTSSERLEVTLPELTFQDLETAAAAYGYEMPELPPGLTALPLGMNVEVRNGGGCGALWSGVLTIVVPIEEEEEEQ